MAGSSKGKQKKGKIQSKSRTGSVNREPEISNSIPTVNHMKSDNVSIIKKLNNFLAKYASNMDLSGWEKSYERALELLFQKKIEALYSEALKTLLDMGYEPKIVHYAIMMNGHIHGRKSLVTNIVDNSVEFLQSKVVTDKEAPQGYTYMVDRVKSLMRSLIMEMQELYPDYDKAYAMKQYLGIGPSSFIQVPFEACSEGDSSAGNSNTDGGCNSETKACDFDHGNASHVNEFVPEEDLKETIPENPVLQEELETSPEYPCDLTSNNPDWEYYFLLLLMEKTPEGPGYLLILDMLKQYRKLKEQVKETREWALKKATEVEQKVHNHVSELERLRLVNLENRKMKADAVLLHKRTLIKVREVHISLWNTMCQIEQSIDNVRMLELQKEEIMKNIECYRSDASKTNKTLRKVEKRERMLLEKVEAMEEERAMLQQEVENQKHKVVQLTEELFDLNKAQDEAEALLVKEKKEKEIAIALCAEEERLKNMSEANLRSKQAAARHREETSRLIRKDDLSRLEDELAKLRLGPNYSFDAIPPQYILLDEPEVSSSMECVNCLMKDASILFLPCAHQVVCSKCNEQELVGDYCPLCHVLIEDRVTVHGVNP